MSVHLSNHDIRRMVKMAKAKALGASRMATDGDVPMSIASAANWATIYQFLTDELLERESV